MPFTSYSHSPTQQILQNPGHVLWSHTFQVGGHAYFIREKKSLFPEGLRSQGPFPNALRCECYRSWIELNLGYKLNRSFRTSYTSLGKYPQLHSPCACWIFLMAPFNICEQLEELARLRSALAWPNVSNPWDTD